MVIIGPPSVGGISGPLSHATYSDVSGTIRRKKHVSHGPHEHG